MQSVHRSRPPAGSGTPCTFTLIAGLDRQHIRAWRRPGGRLYVQSHWLHETPANAEALERRMRVHAIAIADQALERSAA